MIGYSLLNFVDPYLKFKSHLYLFCIIMLKFKLNKIFLTLILKVFFTTKTILTINLINSFLFLFISKFKEKYFNGIKCE